MKTMKTLVLTMVLAAAVCAAPAQEYHQVAITQGGGNALTNVVAASSTNSTASDAIGLTKYGDVTLLLQYNLTANTSLGSNVVFSFTASPDGTNFNSTAPANLVFTLPSNGTNTVTLVTNVNLGSLGYLELFSIANTATNVATNINVQAWVKPKRNG